MVKTHREPRLKHRSWRKTFEEPQHDCHTVIVFIWTAWPGPRYLSRDHLQTERLEADAEPSSARARGSRCLLTHLENGNNVRMSSSVRKPESRLPCYLCFQYDFYGLQNGASL